MNMCWFTINQFPVPRSKVCGWLYHGIMFPPWAGQAPRMAYCCLTRVFGSSKTTKCAKVHWEKIILMVVGLKCRTSTTGLSKPWQKAYVMACQPRHGCFLKGKLATTTCVASQFHQKQKVYPENNLYIAPTAERPTTNPGCSKIIGRPTPIKTTYPGKQYMQCRMLQNEYIQHLFFLYLMFYSKKTLEISQESKAIHALIFHLGITSLVRHVEKSRRCVRFNKVMAPLKSLVRIFPWLPGERSIQYTPIYPMGLFFWAKRKWVKQKALIKKGNIRKHRKHPENQAWMHVARPPSLAEES